MASKSSARKKNYPCLRCKVHVKQNEKAVQCSLCDLWVHKDCEGMSDETFNVLDLQNEEMGQCSWHCGSCHSYARKFDKRMKNLEKRVQDIEKDLPDMQSNIETIRKIARSK